MQIPTIDPMSYSTAVAKPGYVMLGAVCMLVGHWFTKTNPLRDRTVSGVTALNIPGYFYSVDNLKTHAPDYIPQGRGRWSVVAARQSPHVLHDPDYFDSGFVHEFICGTQEQLPDKAYSYHREGMTCYTTYMTLVGEGVLDCVSKHHHLYRGY